MTNINSDVTLIARKKSNFQPNKSPPNDVNSPEVGYLYNIAEITITVLDDDHIGSMRSVNDLSFWTEAELESLKSELNKIFTDTLTQPGYNSENCVSLENKNRIILELNLIVQKKSMSCVSNL